MRRLTDSEIADIRRDAPRHLAITLAVWFHTTAPVEQGMDALLRSAENFIESHTMDSTTQLLFWKGVTKMQYSTGVSYPFPPDATQLSIL